MREHRLTLPELALFAATRAMLGLGIGLLLSDRIERDRRRTAGIALVATGALSTIPFALKVFRASRGNSRSHDTELHRATATTTVD